MRNPSSSGCASPSRRSLYEPLILVSDHGHTLTVTQLCKYVVRDYFGSSTVVPDFDIPRVLKTLHGT